MNFEIPKNYPAEKDPSERLSDKEREGLFLAALERAKGISQDVETLLKGEHKSIDALHVHALPKIQDEWVFLKAKELVDKLDIPYVALNGDLFPQKTLIRSEQIKGKKFGKDVFRGFGGGLWEGHFEWRKRLIEAGIPSEKILSVGTGEYTHSEVDNLVRVAKGKTWKRVISLSSLPQLERTARTFFGTLQRENALDPGANETPAFLFIGAGPEKIDDTLVYASTGEESMNLKDFFIAEQKKVEDYSRAYPDQVGTAEWLDAYRRKSRELFL